MSTVTSGRPAIAFTTDERFDPRSVQPYEGRHESAYQYIDDHLPQHIEELQRWVRQPSVSAQNVGIQEMAELLRNDLLAIGFQQAELVPTDGHPGVFGWYDAGAPRTLLVYMMYDVQPVEVDDWQVPPFDGALVDHALGKVLMARGAVNQKGPERAFLNAVASVIAADGRLPINLLVAAEGEEELGSPHYPQVIARYHDQLRKADGVLFPAFGQNAKGRTTLSLGVKGICYWEFEVVGTGEHGGPTKAEVHGSVKAIVDSPVWRLLQALASLVSEDGNSILVPGYYDDIRPPNDEEQRLVNAMVETWDEATLKKTLAVERLIDGLSGRDALVRLLFDTTLNIDGIWAGYTGEGSKTILPHKATAKVDSRLVPDQTPDRAEALIRRHLDAQGFTDVTIRQLGCYPAAQSSVSSSLVQSVIAVYNKWERTPQVQPRAAGSAPYYVFTNTLGLPVAAGGVGHGSGAHAPNEYIVIEPKPETGIAGLAEVEKVYVDLLYALAGA